MAEEIVMTFTVPSNRLASFWAKVQKTNSCWNWTAGRLTRKYPAKAYGCFRVGGAMLGAHRVSWVIHNGAIPESMSILHKCDNPGCVNPAHLFLGTQRDNVQDMENKRRGRHPKGSAAGLAKLNETQVVGIKIRINSGESLYQIAESYAVTDCCIRDIAKGRTWKHIKV